ncbi:MAG: hypothetical protein SPI34_08025 [Opitutales bacterium]|nr:hypothetical protein [Opitutales bacterium]
MRKIFAIVLPFFAALLAGCATTESTNALSGTVSVNGCETAGTICAENYGYYLFSVVPLFAGNPEKPNQTSMCFFKDTVNLENNKKMIDKEAATLGGGVLCNLQNSVDWTGSFSLWIIWKQVLYSNATVLKPRK